MHQVGQIVITTSSVAHAWNFSPVQRLASILSGLLAPEISPIQEQRVIQYNDRYRLAFTLLNENAASDRHINSWDIQPAIVGKKLSRFI